MRSYTHRHVCSLFLVVCIGLLLLVSQPSLVGRFHPFHEDRLSAPQLAAGAYRAQLSTLRPFDTAPHSTTLGVASRIYVVNLPRRHDRHAEMSLLAQAMDLEFTWHDATDLHSTAVENILANVRAWRNEHRVNNSLPKADPSPFVFHWADDVDVSDPDLGHSGADLWPLRPPRPSISSSTDADAEPPLVIDSYGEAGSLFGTTPVRPAQIACWHTHYTVLRRIAEGPDDVAIVFEDDIDMEWDLELRLRRMWPALPSDWDLVMLGHCQSKEWTHPALEGAPTLHPAYHTLCTHAYAVSRHAALRMVRRMRSEAFAYSRNVDHAVQHLSSYRYLRVFSVFPPVVVQTYQSESDITPGRSKKRADWLDDSVRERIALANAKIES